MLHLHNYKLQRREFLGELPCLGTSISNEIVSCSRSSHSHRLDVEAAALLLVWIVIVEFNLSVGADPVVCTNTPSIVATTPATKAFAVLFA